MTPTLFRFASSRLLLGALFVLLGDSTTSSMLAQDEKSKDPNTVSAEVASDAVSTFLFDGNNPTSIDQLRAMENRVKELSKKVMDATVNIRVKDAQGTGVIVSRDGYVLTAAHVIGQPDEDAFITMADGTQYKARTLGLNRGVDSGMLKIKTENTLPYIEIGESSQLKQGQWVVAIGHPGGLDKDRGMVVRVGRLLYATRSVLRTDSVLVGGDSGGPLVDMNGTLIGIHSRIGGQLWDNIHVPIDAFSDEWDQLAAGDIVGMTPAPYIGINMENESNKVASVIPASPAFAAGIQVNDLIVNLNESVVQNKRDIGTFLKSVKIGDEIKVVVERNSQRLELKLKVGKSWN